MALLIFYFALAIGVSFLCSILEAVLLSITPAYVAHLKETGSPAGRVLDRQKTDPERPLSAILSLNTVAHTVGAAGVGAQAQIVFETLSVSVISAILTLAILVFSEIIPKTIGATYWRPLAVPSAYLTQVLTIGLWPLVLMSRGIGRLISRENATAGMSREEIAALAELGREQGVIDQSESEGLRNLLRFQKYKVSDVLTPRVVAFTLREDQTVSDAVNDERPLRFSRIPLLRPDDRFAGYVMKDEVLAAAARDEHDRPLRELAREVMVVSAVAPLRKVFRRFLRNREHLAVVVDEYGSFAGIVTLEDILETLIGSEIMDEVDEVADMRRLAVERTGSGRNDPPGT